MHRQCWVLLCLAWHPTHAAGELKADALRIDDTTYTHAQHLVDVGDGRKMNLYCSGSGTPTVILDSGLSDSDIVWGFVQPMLAKQTQVCSYDRAGIGYSDRAKRASTTGNIVDDLRNLLRAAAVAPPYIMVGHSLGGLNVRLYAYRHRHEVAGLVLVDPAYEGEFEESRTLDTKAAERLDLFRMCVAAAPKGFVAGTEPFKECVDGPDVEPNAHFSPAINVAIAAVQMRPDFQIAQLSELESLYAVGADQVRAARRPYGDMPIEVLTSGEKPGADPSVRDAESAQAKWVEHQTLANLSSRGVHRSVPNSGHYIQLDRPETVVAAVQEVIGWTKENPRR
jgi:pimeloyl-ACP methyl ester carboxylesterase